MDRDWLAAELRQGRSIEAIAREVGRDPSTVAYWANKHGLVSTHAARHKRRGGVERSELQAMLVAGLTVRAMAASLGLSYTTVRYWLGRHGLRTPRGRRLAETAPARRDDSTRRGDVRRARRRRPHPSAGATASAAPNAAGMPSPRAAGGVKQVLGGGGRRRLLPLRLRALASVRCTSITSTRRRRRSPSRASGVTRSLTAARAEATKCVLLCANCHAEVEAGITVVR